MKFCVVLCLFFSFHFFSLNASTPEISPRCLAVERFFANNPNFANEVESLSSLNFLSGDIIQVTGEVRMEAMVVEKDVHITIVGDGSKVTDRQKISFKFKPRADGFYDLVKLATLESTMKTERAVLEKVLMFHRSEKFAKFSKEIVEQYQRVLVRDFGEEFVEFFMIKIKEDQFFSRKNPVVAIESILTYTIFEKYSAQELITFMNLSAKFYKLSHAQVLAHIRGEKVKIDEDRTIPNGVARYDSILHALNLLRQIDKPMAVLVERELRDEYMKLYPQISTN